MEAASDAQKLAAEPGVWGIVLFDNEEIGSDTAHGAGSPIVGELVRRITLSQSPNGANNSEVCSVR